MKSLEDIEKQWNSEIEEQLRTFPAARVDDSYSPIIDAHIKKQVRTEREAAYKEHKRLGLKWRWLAIRLNVIGLLMLFFQFSAGLFGLFFVFPVLGSVKAKRKCKEKLDAEIASLKKLAQSITNDQDQRRSDIDRTIQGA